MIAKRIMEGAKKGERGPVRLRNAGLAALGCRPSAPVGQNGLIA
jgi:hypothetical protein